jgi:pimeloyl-ACP methyl ester carboxylesterase
LPPFNLSLAAQRWQIRRACPILIFRGAGDQIVPLSATQELQTRFAPHATRIDLPDMGHEPALKHYEQFFSMIGKLHVQEEKKRLSGAD